MNVGLTQRVLYQNGRAYDSLEHAWYGYLKNHRLFFIPNTVDQDFQELADICDLLIITGGDDSTLRRTVEFRIASIMMQQYKPILGVCHGAFLLIDALGGSVEPCLGHQNCEHSVDYLGMTTTVNSYHNQAISRVHSTAQCLALDSDGHCEAWIDGCMGGVVWHPERMSAPFLPSEIQQLIKI